MLCRIITGLVVWASNCLFTVTAFASLTTNMTYCVSPISHGIYDLHMTAFFVCCIIAAVVFSLIIYSLFKFRKSKGAKPAHFDENVVVEVIWTTIPFLILIGLAIPATMLLWKIHNTNESTMTIKITGYQWKWRYEYLDTGVNFFSFLSTPQDQIYNKAIKNKWYLLEVDKPMVVPVNTKVKLLITSDDVIHSWWVPAVGVKQDAVPGFINENWIYVTEVGEYRGQCGELCGINHGFMPIVIKAIPQADFNQWVVEQQKNRVIQEQQGNISTLPQSTLLKIGKMEYERNCAMCHQNNGQGLSTSFPALKNSPVVTSPLDENIAYVLHGVPGTPMQAFGKILDDTTLAAIITYIRQAWGNDVVNQNEQHATVAQPSEIKKIRQQMA